MASYRVTEGGVRFRGAPSLSAETLATLAQDTLGESTDAATVSADGHIWRQVSVNGQTGWIADEFLQAMGSIGGTHGALHFDPSTPDEIQRQDWTCSIRSTMWMLKSVGIDVSPADAQDAMSPRYVSSDDGLLNADGSGIVAVLRDTWGVSAFNRGTVSFDDVAGWAGKVPVAIGGRAWVHWTAVRGVDGSGNLVLANPAGTGGGRWGLATLNRQQFADLGSFSAVVVPVG
jgi:hypothetical protein